MTTLAYRKYLVISNGTIFQTDHEPDAIEFADACDHGKVAFFEIPDAKTFNRIIDDLLATYLDFTGV